MARRLKQGKSKKEIIRCLKRYVAREVFAVLNQMGQRSPTSATRHLYERRAAINEWLAPPPPVDPGDGMGGQGRVLKFYPVHIKDTYTTD